MYLCGYQHGLRYVAISLAYVMWLSAWPAFCSYAAISVAYIRVTPLNSHFLRADTQHPPLVKVCVYVCAPICVCAGQRSDL